MICLPMTLLDSADSFVVPTDPPVTRGILVNDYTLNSELIKQ